MCIAILNTAGTISKKTFKECWNNNPDGGGMAYTDKGKVKLFKELKCFKPLYKQYIQVREENPEANILLHFRIATHGKINETNCHPFLVNKNLAFIHNGMIYGNGMPESHEFSDTYLFNQTILKKLPQNFTSNEAILKLLSEYIGYSKIIFLNGKNEWAILNEDAGIWDGDNWYSNKSYKPAPKLVYSAIPVTPGRYLDYKDKNFWDEGEVYQPIYNKKMNYCECCDESGKTQFVSDYNIEMCEKCIKQYVTDPEKYEA